MLCYESPVNVFQWWEVYRLYRKAFPVSERKPFSVIRNMFQKGSVDVWRFTRDGKFAGLVTTVNGKENILIDYLAVDENQRGKGIGGEILQQMKAHYGDKGLFLEIESTWESGDDQQQRLCRKRFYEKCGFQSMEVSVWLFGVKMELMGLDCELSYEQYRAFYRDYNSPWAAEHIKPAEK